MNHPGSDARRRWLWPVVLVAITVLALGLRWYYVGSAVVYKPIRGDAFQYHAYAWNLVHHGVFSKDAVTLIPDNFRDPGYPLLLAFWMKLLGDGYAWYAAVLLTQALLGALTVTMATQLGRYWLPMRWAAGAGVLMAVWPHSVTINGFVLSETLFGFLCTLAMLLFARAGKRQSKGWAIGAGLVFGAAALTNAVLLPFGILLAAFLAWRKLTPRPVWVALAIGAVLLPGAWAMRNASIPSQTTGDSSSARALQNLVQGSWPIYHAAYIEMVRGDAQARRITDAINAEIRLMKRSPMEGMKAVAHRLAQDPLRYIRWYVLQKPYLLWDWSIRVGQNDLYVFPTKDSPFDTQAVMRVLAASCHGLNPLLALLALLGAIAAACNSKLPVLKNQPASVPALCASVVLLVFVTLVYCALQAEPRYSIPFRAFEILLSASTLYWLTMWISTKRAASTGQKNPDDRTRTPGATHP